MQVSCKRPWAAPVVALIVSTGIVAPLFMQQYTSHSRAKNPMLQQVIRDVTPLCRLLLLEEEGIGIVALPPDPPGGSGTEARPWIVTCINTQGEEKLHVLWQAERKQAIWINRFALPRAIQMHEAAHLEALDQTQAVNMARVWSIRLGMAQQEDAQDCVFTAQRTFTAWCVHLNLPSGKSSVCIDAWTGEFQAAYTRNGSELASASQHA